jgi:hypothetical protein
VTETESVSDRVVQRGALPSSAQDTTEQNHSPSAEEILLLWARD